MHDLDARVTTVQGQDELRVGRGQTAGQPGRLPLLPPLPPSSGDAAIPDRLALARDADDASDRRPLPAGVLAERLGGEDGDVEPVDPTVTGLRRLAPFGEGNTGSAKAGPISSHSSLRFSLTVRMWSPPFATTFEAIDFRQNIASPVTIMPVRSSFPMSRRASGISIPLPRDDS